MMIIISSRFSYKHGTCMSDKSDPTTIAAFDVFHTKAETTTRRKIQQLRTDWALDTIAWGIYCQQHGIMHEFMVPCSSAQNGLSEQAIRTTIDDVRALLCDSGLGHSHWAEAASYSIDTHNLVPSQQHPDHIPLELFTGKRQNVAHLQVFGSRCWAKVPIAYGEFKLNP